jgi:potassium-dependent mechanosensitive channel
MRNVQQTIAGEPVRLSLRPWRVAPGWGLNAAVLLLLMGGSQPVAAQLILSPSTPGAEPVATGTVPGALPGNSTGTQEAGAAQAPAAAVPVASPQDNLPVSPPVTPPAAGNGAANGATLEAIAARLEQVQRSTELDPAVKDSLSALYQRALADLKAASEAQRIRKELGLRLAAAPAALAEAKRRRERLPARPEPLDGLDYLSFDELQSDLQARQARLAAATELRTRLVEQTDMREKRRKELPQLLSEARARVEQLEREQNAPAPTQNADPALREATAWTQTAAKQAALEQVQLLEQEQRVYEAETELLPLQLEIARAEERALQEQTRQLREELDRLRQDRIIRQRQEVRALVQETPDSLKELGEQLLRRTQSWLELAQKKAQVKSELDSSRTVLERWKDRYTKMVNRVEPQAGQDVTAGFNSWVGLMLRKQKSELPDPQAIDREIRHYQQEDQLTDVLLFELEDALQQIHLWTEEGYTLGGTTLAGASVRVPGAPAVEGSAQTLLERLLAKDKELIEAMKIDIDTYQNDLYQVADIKEQTRALVRNYHAFIERHVLWIRSSDQLQRSEFKLAAEAFHWLVSYDNWNQLVRNLVWDMAHRPWWWVLFVSGLVLILFNHTRMRRSIVLVGEKASKSNATSFVLTTEGLLLTVVISLPVPLVLLFLYWRLSGMEDSGGFCKAVGHGLLIAAVVFIPLEILRQLSRTHGLGIKHFDWHEETAKLLSRNLRWMIDLATPTAAIVGVMEGQANTRWESSLGRLAFLALMLLLLVFFARVFVPSRGVFAEIIKRHPGGWFDRLRYGWYTLIVASPIVLATLSYIGFHYTAQRLAMHVHTSFWVLIAIALLYNLLRRWLLLSRRTIMIAQARQRLSEAAKRDPAQTTPPPAEENEVNLTAINEQTMRLVTSFVVVLALVSLGLIWSDVLPAIGMLENIRLWDVQGSRPDEIVNITLANLLFVLPLAALTVIAARNLPGLMEIALLQHLPLTGAARYAISTLSRYTILFLGIAMVSSAIGLRWQNIQWLVAALGVGLGFGLQEIFANFVSGLILLFEQPIRVGDVITMDGTTGTVSRIRMRATTITNWDRQELVIPNKDLVTGKLLNWTLSDATNRVQVRVGIAYGSDTELACQILRDICHAHRNILKDPPSSVIFDGFGDSSLNLIIRAFLSSLDVRLETLHELHTEIHRRFREAGIEIAFPQRDLHVRSVSRQLVDVLARGTAAGAGAGAGPGDGERAQASQGPDHHDDDHPEDVDPVGPLPYGS